MYITDLKKDFFEFLFGKRIYLMVNYDIDSICTCKIFQTIIKNRHILYSIAVINGVSDLSKTFRENCEHVKIFVLINCGGTLDIVDIVEPEDDIIFFILDSHRPTDLSNIYSNGQIRLLSSAEDDQQVPDFYDVFREESDDEDENEENEENEANDDEDNDEVEEGRVAKRRRLNEEALEKRRERRLWEENQRKLLFDYSQFTYYAKASAVQMFELAWKIAQDDLELLWLAIIGLTEQLVFNKIENTLYVLEMTNLKTHASRLNNRVNDKDIATTKKINFEKDLKLVLYRHWSVESSLKYSPFTACKLKLWTHRGDKKLQELLADMGLPLVQSRQLFKSMDLQLRKEFHSSLERLTEKYELQDLIFASFNLHYGYNKKYCALDMVYVLLAILEAPSRDKNREELFNRALDCLNRRRKDIMENAIESAKLLAQNLFKTVKGAIDLKQIITAGPFIYFIIQEGSLDWYMFSQPHVLLLLAHFILRAYVSMSRNRKALTLPLIVSAPKNLETNTCIILGIPPLCENSPKNFFGKAFEQAAERINCESTCNFFDTSYFELLTKNRTRFFDALIQLLT